MTEKNNTNQTQDLTENTGSNEPVESTESQEPVANEQQDSFSSLLEEFQQYKVGDFDMIGSNENVSTEPEKPADEVEKVQEQQEIEHAETNIKEDTANINTDDSASDDGSVDGVTENGNKFIEDLVSNPEKIKELYLANQEKQEELSRLKSLGVDEKISAVGDLKADDIALLKAAKSGDINAIAKLIQEAKVDPVDLVGHEVPEDFKVENGSSDNENNSKQVLSADAVLKRMSAQATVDGVDPEKVLNVLGDFDEQSLFDIASDPDNSKKVLSSIDDVEKAIKIYQEDLKYDFANKLGNFDSFEQLSYGLKKLSEQSKAEPVEQTSKTEEPKKVLQDKGDDKTKDVIAEINNQQKSFPSSGSTTTEQTGNTDSFEELLKEYRSTVY